MKTVTVIFLAVMISCSQQPNSGVKYYGALKNYRAGDISAKFNLADLNNQTHVYGLGAVANLKGEIVVWDSEIFVSSVIDSSIVISKDKQTAASLFVFAQVAEWQSSDMAHIESLASLQEQLVIKAKSIGLTEPFPFLLEGTVKSVSWHVIDWDEKRTDHNPKSHKESGLSGEITNTQAKIVGFYSSKHKAIFTHHDSNLHLHILTDNKNIVAHVDQLFFEKMTIRLPI